MVEGDSGMEESSERRMTSGRLDMAQAVFGKTGFGGGSGLDSVSCKLLRKILGSRDTCPYLG